jgi:hypothetical protein
VNGYLPVGLQRYFTNIKPGVVWRQISYLFYYSAEWLIPFKHNKLFLKNSNKHERCKGHPIMQTAHKTMKKVLYWSMYNIKLPRIYGSDTFVIPSTIHNSTVTCMHARAGNHKNSNYYFKSNKLPARSKILSVINLTKLYTLLRNSLMFEKFTWNIYFYIDYIFY